MRGGMGPAPKVVLLATALLACSCASIINDYFQDVEIVSDPVGAEVFDHGQRLGVAPMTHRMDRSWQHHDLAFKLAGHQDVQLKTGRERSLWFWGNLLLGPLFPLGMLIDDADGAAYNITPDAIAVTLVKSPPSR